MDPSLTVVMYHYVRDLPRTPFPSLKAMLLDDFRRQLAELCERYEMATLESTLAFLGGAYRPSRELSLLTFDDGLKEHYREVTPLLAERKVEGQFFVISSCLEEHTVAPVHMNHFLMAGLEFATYRRAFLERCPDAELAAVERPAARTTYPWDTAEVAAFKYFFNFVLDASVRDAIVRELFVERIAPEAQFSAELYLSWEEARRMQQVGMVLGGHSHEHRPLAALADDELRADLGACRALLDRNLGPQPRWPFCFPYGKTSSFNAAAVAELARLGFACAFTTESGPNLPGTEVFTIRRVDCKNVKPLPMVAAQ